MASLGRSSFFSGGHGKASRHTRLVLACAAAFGSALPLTVSAATSAAPRPVLPGETPISAPESSTTTPAAPASNTEPVLLRRPPPTGLGQAGTSTTAPALAGAQAGRGAGGAPGDNPGREKGRSGTTKKAQKASPPLVQVLNPGTVTLVRSLAADERRLVSVEAYGQALAYLRSARAVEAQASRLLAAAKDAWSAAEVQQQDALRTEASDARWVNLFDQALYEIGIAEYTGETQVDGPDIAAQQHQLVVNQWGEVAATDTSSELNASQRALAEAKERVRFTTALARSTGRQLLAARHSFARARAQLVTSQHALLDARYWVSAPSQAPAQPEEALVSLEVVVPYARDIAGVARPVFSRSTTTTTMATSTTTTANGVARNKPGTSSAIKAGSQRAAQIFEMGPAILGPSLLTAGQITAWFESTGALARTTVPIGPLVADYMTEGHLTGVRADIAFAQSIVETGYFSFPMYGQDPESYNNFAGIGACDSCKHGFHYNSALAGVAAQEDLLEEYALPYTLPTNLASFGVAGNSQTWMELSGTWATNINYGYAILSVYQLMLDFVIESKMASYGLLQSQPQYTPKHFG
ncbi:MAG TPA: glucosaminidase domain-containing protein [Acidimicrobiales bacterium]|nr:glucosaminidase domain-containing protein [Acidimicrobiales bacterium]